MIPFSEPHIAEITRVIELAVAPVFLLTAVGTLVMVLTNRLGRAVDRSRVLEDRLPSLGVADSTAARTELRLLARRIRLVYLAISLAVLSALFVCLLIAGAFAGAFVAVDLTRLVAALFVLAIVALTGSLVVFLREIFLAVTSARLAIPEEPTAS
jgi:hypothetical protein